MYKYTNMDIYSYIFTFLYIRIQMPSFRRWAYAHLYSMQGIPTWALEQALQHTAPQCANCITLQPNVLQLQHIATHKSWASEKALQLLQYIASQCTTMRYNALQCTAMIHTALLCTYLHFSAPHCNTHCNTPHYTTPGRQKGRSELWKKDPDCSMHRLHPPHSNLISGCVAVSVPRYIMSVCVCVCVCACVCA